MNEKRIEALIAFAKALREALSRAMPAGYEGAADDRSQYVSPVEQVVYDMEAEALTLRNAIPSHSTAQLKAETN